MIKVPIVRLIICEVFKSIIKGHCDLFMWIISYLDTVVI